MDMAVPCPCSVDSQRTAVYYHSDKKEMPFLCVSIPVWREALNPLQKQDMGTHICFSKDSDTCLA